ncbi:MAG: threonine ammonia-lyase, biosynthetic [Acidimicrobiales bacterium]
MNDVDLEQCLRRTLTSRVYDVVDETPLDRAPQLSERLGRPVLLKREDLQPVYSFKIRGAYNKMAQLPPEELERGVVTSSAGNHAQGVALAAQHLGTTAVIVMPTTTPEVKVEAVRARGAEIVLAGVSYSDCATTAAEISRERGLAYIPPFDDVEVMAGQGTIGMEILRQHTRPLDAIVVPIGGGGLIAGIAAYVKAVRPGVRIVGAQTVDSDAMARSVAAGERVELDEVGLFADGTAVKLVGAHTFEAARRWVDDFVVVDTDAICAAIKDVFADTRAILEPSGALAVAGLKAWSADHPGTGPVVAVASGANMNFDRLRFVSERAEIGEQREAVFAVTIPERRGSFRRFCEIIGPSRSVTEFNYRIADAEEAYVFVGIQVADRAEASEIAEAFTAAGLDTLDLTDDELAKVHLRHLVGGRSHLARDERIHRFEFPERPGALIRFLTSMAPDWNISLFHYRNHGADVGRVLVGMQVPSGDDEAFGEFLRGLGYRSWDESDHPAYRKFLGA